MGEDGDKLSRIYSVLTDEEVHAWVSSDEEELKLPRESVTAAFREAELAFIEFSSKGSGDDDLEDNYDE